MSYIKVDCHVAKNAPRNDKTGNQVKRIGNKNGKNTFEKPLQRPGEIWEKSPR